MLGIFHSSHSPSPPLSSTLCPGAELAASSGFLALGVWLASGDGGIRWQLGGKVLVLSTWIPPGAPGMLVFSVVTAKGSNVCPKHPFQLQPPNVVGILGGRISVPASTSLHTLATVLALCPDSGPADPAPSSSHLGQGQQRITDPWGPVSSQLECALCFLLGRAEKTPLLGKTQTNISLK